MSSTDPNEPQASPGDEPNPQYGDDPTSDRDTAASGDPRGAKPSDPTDEPEPVPMSGPRRGGSGAVRALALLTVVLLVMVAFLGGVWMEREFSGARDSIFDVDRLDQVADLIEADYYRGPAPGEDDDEFAQRLEDGALIGVAAGAGDPYTAYLPPDDAAPLASTLSGEYGGIGVTVQQRDTQTVVTDLTAAGPAQRAGVQTGDVLTSVDSVDVTGLALPDVGDLIRGEIGSTVVLGLARPATGEQLELSITRERLETPAVTYQLDAATGVAVIRMTVFNAVSTGQLDEALARSRADGARGIVFDLRGNGGGSVTAAQEAIGRFVPADRGPALYETTGRASEAGAVESLPIIAEGITPDTTTPMVILVDGNTASAAEIMAASLRDYGRAPVWGTETFGKGSVQRIYPFEDGSILRVTIAEWLTPGQSRLDGVGVTIDVTVQPGATSDGRDAQVAAATDYLTSGTVPPPPQATPASTPGAGTPPAVVPIPATPVARI